MDPNPFLKNPHQTSKPLTVEPPLVQSGKQINKYNLRTQHTEKIFPKPITFYDLISTTIKIARGPSMGILFHFSRYGLK